MPLPNPGMNFTPFDPLPAASLDDLVENIEALAAGTGIGVNAVAAASLATNAIKLGATSLTSTFTTNATTATLVTGLSSTVTIPAGGRSVLIIAHAPNNTTTAGSPDVLALTIWDGTVGSGTQIGDDHATALSSGYTNHGLTAFAYHTPGAGSKTYNVGFQGSQSANHSVNASSTAPVLLLVFAT